MRETKCGARRGRTTAQKAFRPLFVFSHLANRLAELFDRLVRGLFDFRVGRGISRVVSHDGVPQRGRRIAPVEENVQIEPRAGGDDIQNLSRALVPGQFLFVGGFKHGIPNIGIRQIRHRLEDQPGVAEFRVGDGDRDSRASMVDLRVWNRV